MSKQQHRFAAMAIGLVVALAASAVCAEDECASRENPADQYPGLKLSSSYPHVKRHVPASAGCAAKTDDGCRFIDRYGIENVFTAPMQELDGKGPDYRLLSLRIQTRQRGGWLPYGVKWSDSFAAAMSKLKPHGGAVWGDPNVIEVSGCWSRTDGYSLSFEFDKAGRLAKVQQSYQAN